MLLQADIARVQLAIDLGRYEVAEETLFSAEERLEPLARRLEGGAQWWEWCRAYLGLARNQLRFQSERYDRMVAVDGEWLDEDSRTQQASYDLRAALRLAAQAATAGEGPGTAPEALLQRARAFGAATEAPPAIALTVDLDLAALELALDDASGAAESLERVRGHLETLVGGGLLGAEMGEMLLVSLEARLARARGLGDLAPLALRARQAWRGLSRAWAESPTLEGGIGFLGLPLRRELLFQTLRLVRAVEGDAAAFDLLAETQALGSLDRALGHGAPSLDDLRSRLARHSACLVSWVPGAQETLACVVDGEGVTWYRCAPLARCGDAFSRLRRGLDRRSQTEDLAEACAELGAALLPGALVERVGAHERVALVGADLLGARDLEALSFGARGPLGLALAVSQAPSIPWLAATLEAAEADDERPARTLVVCATGVGLDSPTLGRFPALPHPPAVDRVLTGAAEGEQLDVLLADEARPSSVLSSLDRPYTRFVFLGHGVQDFERPIPSGLVVAGDDGDASLLWAEDLAARALPEECVVLACRVSRGHARRGDAGSADLAGALLRGGAHCALASSRDLDLELALELYDAWHAARAAGQSAALALRTARRAVVASSDRDPAEVSTALQLHGHGWER